MAKNYRDNFDYSEAIANSTSKAERDRLLAERQNKIDAEGLTGRVADNSAVSTWTKGYRPYYVASASSASKAAQENAERVSSLYDAAEKARLERFEAARTRIRQQLDANLSSIDSDYASAVASGRHQRPSVRAAQRGKARAARSEHGRKDRRRDKRHGGKQPHRGRQPVPR